MQLSTRTKVFLKLNRGTPVLTLCRNLSISHRTFQTHADSFLNKDRNLTKVAEEGHYVLPILNGKHWMELNYEDVISELNEQEQYRHTKNIHPAGV